MTARRILVINPNSNEAVTDGLREAVAGLVSPGRLEVTCETMQDGPFGLETQAHVDGVVMLLRARVLACSAQDAQAHDTQAHDAYVIACYSDPGLHACREVTTKPVFGIAACGMLAAMARAETFGVIAIRDVSIRRHMRMMRQMGIISALAGERALDMSVAEAASGEGTLDRMIAVGRELRDKDRAQSIVMGCAGMARHRAPLEQALGIPVIDPTQAAVAIAIGAVAVA